MNTHSLGKLALVVALLLAGVFVVNLNLHDESSFSGKLLLADLKAQANNLQKLTISGSDDGPGITIVLQDGSWVVPDRQDFPANTATLRALVRTLADAKTLEPKTSDPARYALLGVDEGSAASGRTVTLKGENFEYAVILGKEAQGNYRYARLVGDPQSWLINADPEIPEDVGEWLNPEVIDIPAASVRSVTIRHADGEVLRIFKDAEEDSDFQVENIPAGHELNYPTVANGLGGVLDGLTLDDVRSASGFDGEARANTRFELFDGRVIVADVYSLDDEYWVALSQRTDDEEQTAAGTGWLYRVPDYKRNLLMRRWDDILKDADE